MKTAFSLLFTTCLLAGASSLVLANEAAAAPPTVGGDSGPEEQACMGKVASDPCSLPNGSAGTCGEGTCSRLDYSQGSPPKAVEEPCIVCKSGPSPGGAPQVGGDGVGGDAAGAAPSDDGEDKQPPESSSRCTVAAADSPVRPLETSLLMLGLFVGWRTRASRRANRS